MTAAIKTAKTFREAPPSRPEGRPKWEPRLPEFFGENDLKSKHPQNVVDHRPNGGPLLSLLWCNQPLHGQTLFLGGEVGVDGKIYCIPGHANRVLRIDPVTDAITLIGPDLSSNGTRFKWLRGVPVGDVIYGLPCHASEVLRIHVPTQTITKIPIPYEEFYHDPQVASEQRKCIWKYHGGSVSEHDGCIYAIPQSALHVLKIDPTTDTCSFVGPPLPGKYKWYGGVALKDGAIYCVPQNSPHVLRIHPDKITLHGKWKEGGHKWHGAAKAENDVIVCIPNNVDTVLCITGNGDEPILTEIGDESIIQTGRHRTDKKYKYLGAMAGTNGRVYVFPSGSEFVLEVDTEIMAVRNVGPNLRDTGMERIFQNKWQNGLTNPYDECVYAIPLAGETVLRIDCSKGDDGDVEVTTWPLPSPYETLDKFEGGVLCPNGLMYTVPNNCKAVLKIQPYNWTPNTTSVDSKRNAKKKISSIREYGGKDDSLVYKSGIPTLRSSAHRVKFDVKHRKYDPMPVDKDGNETNTTRLPEAIQEKDIFAYDETKYDLRDAVVNLLKKCDPVIVGSFEQSSDSVNNRLENFRVPVNSIWRSVNGGCCEDAQKYLSEQVVGNVSFLELFDKFIIEVVLPYVKNRLVACGALVAQDRSCTFHYQRPPTLRLQPGPGWAKVKPHNDAEYGHQNGELNIWLPLTDRTLTGVDLWSESSFGANDYHPIAAKVGEAIAWHGSSRRHYVNANSSRHTRVSLDFRIGIQGFFDPHWEMQGTTHDHTRREIEI